jgi:hypothetical protein
MSTLAGSGRFAWAATQLCCRSSTSSLRSLVSFHSRRSITHRGPRSKSTGGYRDTKSKPLGTEESGEVAQMLAGSYSEELGSALKAVRLASALCQVDPCRL